jgi:hypothetical protein
MQHAPVDGRVNVDAQVLEVVVSKHLVHVAREVSREPQDKRPVLILAGLVDVVHPRGDAVDPRGSRAKQARHRRACSPGSRKNVFF